MIVRRMERSVVIAPFKGSGRDMRKPKREVVYDGKAYKVRSDTIALPDFAQIERMEALVWLCRHTYARGYSKADPIAGIGGAVQISVG